MKSRHGWLASWPHIAGIPLRSHRHPQEIAHIGRFGEDPREDVGVGVGVVVWNSSSCKLAMLNAMTFAWRIYSD